MSTALCTLFEGHYHYGVAALVNSLLANGFEGQLWAGHRGPLPSWVTGSPHFDAASGRLQMNERLSVHFVPLETPLFFAYYKPVFMQRVMHELAPQAESVAYIDPDIVLKCPWANIVPWFQGVALIEDMNWNCGARHPKRLLWQQWLEPRGYPVRRALDRYYNSGFLGVPRQNAKLLDLWAELCRLVADHNAHVHHIKSGDASDLFHSTDQDAMNYALMSCEGPMELNTAGPEAMDFMQGGYYFSHAVGAVKPWLGKHIRRAFKGRPPTPAARAYYLYANAPIQMYGPLQFRLRRASVLAASLIGRLYRRA